MKNQYLLFLVSIFVLGSFGLSAQQFSIPMEGFSRNKPAYLFMEDGSEKSDVLGGFKRKKGLITEVKLKNESGDKVSVDPSKIDYMYLAPSSLAKMNAALEKTFDMNKWDKETTMDTSLINDGYVYFEKVNTLVKKNEMDLMLQLMNVPFCSKIRVYHDPFARETMSVGVAGVDVAGGLDKSYYIKKDSEDKAYKLEKKDYDKEFKRLFGDNEDFMSKYGKNPKWKDFESHVFNYTRMSEK